MLTYVPGYDYTIKEIIIRTGALNAIIADILDDLVMVTTNAVLVVVATDDAG